MVEHRTHYPNFDVMRQEEHWDPHTREIVARRVKTESFLPYQSLTAQEGDTLYRLCTFLLDDKRTSVIAFVVHHLDSTLNSKLGEAQRKAGVPKQSDLIRGGLAWLEQVCNELYGLPFLSLEEAVQQQAVREIVQGVSVFSRADKFPVKDWLDKLVSEAVSAYYSHPAIWSEIGYAGPAYPRGYVRSEFGLTDPWEARRNGQ